MITTRTERIQNMPIEEYAKHIERLNGELYKCINEQRMELTRFRMALCRIKETCKGCPASDMAAEALETEDEEEDDTPAEEDSVDT